MTIVDDCYKEANDLACDFNISGQYVTRILDRAARFRCYPAAIRTDQGQEFTGKTFDQWTYEHDVLPGFSKPGKPTDNALIESLKGSFRNECLNAHWFMSLENAREKI